MLLSPLPLLLLLIQNLPTFTFSHPPPSPSSALVVCAVDGTVYSISAHHGDILGMFISGDSIVSSHTTHTEPEGDEEDVKDVTFTDREIIPGLDGLIYERSSVDGLSLLPLSAGDIIQAPRTTCDKDSSCSIVMGTKKTMMYGLDISSSSSSLKWMQESGAGGRGFTTTNSHHFAESSSYADSSSDSDSDSSEHLMLLQREDYEIRSVGVADGMERWNLTVAHFSALDKPEPSDAVSTDDDASPTSPNPTTTSGGQRVFPRREILHNSNDHSSAHHSPSPSFPKIIWNEAENTISGYLDSKILWTRNFPAAIVSLYGVEAREWVDVTILPEEDVATPTDPSKQLTVPYTPQFPLVSKITTATGHASYVSPVLSILSGISPTDDATCSVIDIDTPSSPHTIQKPEAPPHGLFLTYEMILTLVIVLVALALVGGRFLYDHLKRRWYSKLINTPNFGARSGSVSATNGSRTSSPENMPEMQLPSPAALQQTLSDEAPFQKPAMNKSASLPILDAGSFEQGDAPQSMDEIKEELSRPLSVAASPIGPSPTPTPPPSLTPTFTTDTTTTATTPVPVEPTQIAGIPLSSRYHSEFKETAALGRGGFGSVYQVLNTLDGCEYAVKKIRINATLETLERKLNKVLREVKILAVLDHPNIVRYYTSWLEVDNGEDAPDDQDGFEESTMNSASQSVAHKSIKQQRKKHAKDVKTHRNADRDRKQRGLMGGASEDDLGFSWERSEAGEPLEELSRWTEDGDEHEESSAWSADSLEDATIDKIEEADDEDADSSHSRDRTTDYCDMSNLSPNPSNADTPASPPSSLPPLASAQKRFVLYIQMTYCSQRTLRDFLSDPAQRANSKDSSRLDIPHALELFGQVSKGVKYVHSHGLIHRDIKPSNCFVDNGTVKIGDFGLSREISTSDARTTDVSFESVVDRESDPRRSLTNTAGVGTYIYASPEQIASRDYDASTDVYSLGVMLFELTNAMYSMHERSLVLGELHEGKFPKSWLDSTAKEFPELHELIKAMVDHHPSSRPTPEEVCVKIDQILGRLTVLSLDRSTSRGDGAVLLRVEAEDASAAFPATIAMIEKAAPGIKIEQYGLRGVGGQTIMEFAISGVTQDENGTLAQILRVLNESDVVGMVRQVSEKHQSFDAS